MIVALSSTSSDLPLVIVITVGSGFSIPFRRLAVLNTLKSTVFGSVTLQLS